MQCDFCQEEMFHSEHFACSLFSGVEVPDNRVSIKEMEMLTLLGFHAVRNKRNHRLALYAGENCVLLR